MLTARKLVQSKLHDVETSLRGILRGFGLKVGPTTPKRFEARIQELVTGHPSLQVIAGALLAVRAVLLREFNGFEKRVRIMARANRQAKLLMSTLAVGPIVALRSCDRRCGTVQIVENDGRSFRTYAEEVPVRRDRPQRADQQDRRCRSAPSALSGRPRHADKAAQGLLAAQELGDAARQARRHEQGQGRARAQARRAHASHARRWKILQPNRQDQASRCGSIRRTPVFGRVTTPGLPRSEVPSLGRWIRSGRNAGCGIPPRLCRLADLSPHEPHQATALRRSRTEAGSSDRMTQERD